MKEAKKVRCVNNRLQHIEVQLSLEEAKSRGKYTRTKKKKGRRSLL
jgi:hypothetical protein